MDQFQCYLADIRDRIKFFIQDHPLPCRNKFNPRKSAPRKNPPISSLYYLDYSHRLSELGLEHEPTHLQFNNQRFTFQNGKWMPHCRDNSTSGQCDPMKCMRDRNRILQEQNNILTLKMEMLMDMLTETTANLLLLEEEGMSRNVRESQSTNRSLVETEEEDVTCEYELYESGEDQTKGRSQVPSSDDAYEYEEDLNQSDKELEPERSMTKCEIFRKNFMEKSKGGKAGQVSKSQRATKTHEQQPVSPRRSESRREPFPKKVMEPKVKKGPGQQGGTRAKSYEKLGKSGRQKVIKRQSIPNPKPNERMYEIKIPTESGPTSKSSNVKTKPRKTLVD